MTCSIQQSGVFGELLRSCYRGPEDNANSEQYRTLWKMFFFLFFQRGGCGFGSLESVVGIATSYELYGPAFESRQGKSFFSAPEPSIPPLLPTQPSIQ